MHPPPPADTPTPLSTPPLFAFCFNATATTDIYTLSLHDALPICGASASPSCNTSRCRPEPARACRRRPPAPVRSEEHTSELQSLRHLVCRLLLEKKKNNNDHSQTNNKGAHDSNAELRTIDQHVAT